MAKQKKRRPQTPTAATSLPARVHPDATFGPGASREPTTGSRYFADATSAEVRPEDRPGGPFAETGWALLDKHFLSGRSGLPIPQLLFLVVVIAAAWIFVQDNGRGSFAPGDWGAIGWTFIKCLMVFVIVGLLVGAFLLLARLTRR